MPTPIDDCHLKGEYGGILLATIEINANNEIVSFAIAIYEIENTKTYGWFLSLLHDYLDDGREITFVSDRQKGLVSALEQHSPLHTVDIVGGTYMLTSEVYTQGWL